MYKVNIIITIKTFELFLCIVKAKMLSMQYSFNRVASRRNF
jgi:hypothetical protein